MDPGGRQVALRCSFALNHSLRCFVALRSRGFLIRAAGAVQRTSSVASHIPAKPKYIIPSFLLFWVKAATEHSQ